MHRPVPVSEGGYSVALDIEVLAELGEPALDHSPDLPVDPFFLFVRQALIDEVALSFVITSSPTLCCAYTHPLACPFRFFEIAYVIPVKERNLLDGEFRGADDRGDVGSRSYRGRPTQQELAG